MKTGAPCGGASSYIGNPTPDTKGQEEPEAFYGAPIGNAPKDVTYYLVELYLFNCTPHRRAR